MKVEQAAARLLRVVDGNEFASDTPGLAKRLAALEVWIRNENERGALGVIPWTCEHCHKRNHMPVLLHRYIHWACERCGTHAMADIVLLYQRRWEAEQPQRDLKGEEPLTACPGEDIRPLREYADQDRELSVARKG